MNPIFRNILAVVSGVVVGSIVNMSIVTIGSRLIPLPDGADDSTLESLRASMHLFAPANFVFPFLAHAIGTLAGAFVAAKMAVSYRMSIAAGLGVFFLAGGVAAVAMLGGPTWFKVADLLLAYLPMGYLGSRLAGPAKMKPH